MKRYVLLAVVCLSLAATASALQADRSSYDPMAHHWQAQQHKGIVEKTLAGINPQDKNYGAVVGDWRKEVFENTLHQVYFWSLILLGMGFGVYCAVAPILPTESVRRTAGRVALCAPKGRVRKSRAVSGLIRKMCDGTRATGNS